MFPKTSVNGSASFSPNRNLDSTSESPSISLRQSSLAHSSQSL